MSESPSDSRGPGHGQQAEVFRRRLMARCDGPVTVRINNNTSTLVSVRPGNPPVLSVHQIFLTCGDDVIRALAQYVRRPTDHCRRVLRRFIAEREGQIASEARRPVRLNLRSRGRVYDLHALAEQVKAEHFGPELRVHITWGRGSRQRRGPRRHIVFGSFEHRSRVIRIHPVLDSADVPEFFVRFVIFHEMLHAVLDPEHDADGRRYVHTPEFRRLERQHPDYHRAMQWEAEFMRGGA